MSLVWTVIEWSRPAGYGTTQLRRAAADRARLRARRIRPRFHGPMLRSEGKADFLAGSAGLCPIMRGADVYRQWEEGDELCSIYDFKIETRPERRRFRWRSGTRSVTASARPRG
jgi:hypothetical protein